LTDGGTATHYFSVKDTVPQTKVWKITHANFYSQNGSVKRLLINNGGYTFDFSTSNPNFNTPLVDGPIWLKSGDIIQLNMNSNTPCYYQYLVSIIEFNVIP
jgi:hypothetical protein